MAGCLACAHLTACLGSKLSEATEATACSVTKPGLRSLQLLAAPAFPSRPTAALPQLCCCRRAAAAHKPTYELTSRQDGSDSDGLWDEAPAVPAGKAAGKGKGKV